MQKQKMNLCRSRSLSLPVLSFFVLIDQIGVETLDGHIRFVHFLVRVRPVNRYTAGHQK